MKTLRLTSYEMRFLRDTSRWKKGIIVDLITNLGIRYIPRSHLPNLET